MGVRTFRDLRAWQSARAFKLSVYKLADSGAFATENRLRHQLREAAASSASQISEGFGRFDPFDFARFVKMARASLIECQNHLEDAVDRGLITEGTRKAYDQQAQEALKEMGGLIDYLQSPQAKRNADRLRQSRVDRRNRRSNSEP
jgi:four helix bundle protein